MPPRIAHQNGFYVLDRFDVWENNLNGPIPTEFGRLSNMGKNFLVNRENLDAKISATHRLPFFFTAYLYLGRNSYGGTIPSEFGLMSGLCK